MGERHGNCATCDSLLLPAAVSLHVARGDLPAAETFCRQLEAEAEEYGSRTWVAMACQTRGELAATRGDLDGAIACYSEAHEAFSGADNVYEAARCGAAMADLLERRDAPGDAEAATQARSEARQVLERLGAVAEQR